MINYAQQNIDILEIFLGSLLKLNPDDNEHYYLILKDIIKRIEDELMIDLIAICLKCTLYYKYKDKKYIGYKN